MKLEVLNQIKDKFKSFSGLDTKLKFVCYFDNMFNYEFIDGIIRHDVILICDDTLMDKMPMVDLLNLKGLKYFEYSVYIEIDSYKPEVEYKKTYNINDSLN